MKRNNLWLIPLSFFLICCILDIVGCMACHDLERCVKPALMLLLCLTTFTWLLTHDSPSDTQASGSDRRYPAAALLLCGQLFGFAGDTMLMGRGLVFFASGIGLFLIGHLFYISLFGKYSFKGLKLWHWVVGISCSLAIVAAMALIIGVNGIMLIPMGIYAFVLMMLIFSTLTGVIRFGGLTWWLLFCGVLLFTFSDSLIAVKSFSSISRFMDGFVIMFTYLLAQGLLAIGALRLITRSSSC